MAEYWEHTFPIMVRHENQVHPVICTVQESLAPFKVRLRGDFGLDINTGRLEINWSLGGNGHFWGGVIDESNLQPILRMMRARPGKDVITVH